MEYTHHAFDSDQTEQRQNEADEAIRREALAILDETRCYLRAMVAELTGNLN